MTAETSFHCGYVAVIGRPNVGKSTMINRIIGQKVSIVTPKPQTTRHRILGVLNRDDCQYIFVDTPGLHDASGRAINRIITRTARSSLVGVDAESHELHGQRQLSRRVRRCDM